MRTFGTKSKYFVILFILWIGVYNISAQQLACPCNRSTCGDIIASFKLGGDQTVVCDGHEFSVINNSTIPDVSYFIWDWGDGRRDSVLTTESVKHTYNIPDDKVCQDVQSTYEICLLAVKRCGNLYSCHTNRSPVTVIHRPIAKFTYTNSVCINKNVSFTNTSCNVDGSLPDAYLWTFHDGTTATTKNASKTYPNPGTYIVKLRVKNGCSENEISEFVQVVDFPNAVVQISENAIDSVVCVGERVTLINKSNQWSKIVWTFPTLTSRTVLNDTVRWKLTLDIRNLEKRLPVDTINKLDTIIFDVLTPGTYVFKLTSSNDCGQKDWIYTLKVISSPTAILNLPLVFCETATYTPNLIVSGINDSLLSYQWTFPGGTPSSYFGKIPGLILYNQPGNYKISVAITSPCNTITPEVDLIVYSRTPVKILNGKSTFCKNSGFDTLKVDRSGGAWSPTNKISALGVINTANANLIVGKHLLKYTIGPPGCQSIDSILIDIVNPPVISTKDETICENSAPIQLTANPLGGIWSGTGVDSSGLFNPKISKSGIFNAVYFFKDNNACSTSKTAKITVEKTPNLTALDSIVLCKGNNTIDLRQSLNINTNITGGIFTYFIDSFQVNQFLNLSVYAAQKIPITIQYDRNQCRVKDTSLIILNEPVPLITTQDTFLCKYDSLFTLQVNVNNGTWTGPGLKPNTSIVDLTKAGAGDKIFTFTHGTSATCMQTIQVKLTIKDPKIGLNAGKDTTACTNNTTFTLSGFTPAGGTWAGPEINNTQVNISMLNPDSNYTFIYTILDNDISSCAASDSMRLSIKPLPIPDFDVKGIRCANKEITVLNKTKNITKSLLDLGDGAISSSDSTVHKYNQKGNYNLNLLVTDKFGCQNEISKQIYVSDKPSVDFQIDNKIGCAPFTLDVQNKSFGDSTSYTWFVNGQMYNSKILAPLIIDNIKNDSVFKIKLDVFNFCGTESKLDSITVLSYPKVNFGFNSLQGCSPFLTTFFNTTSGDKNKYFWNFGNGEISTDEVPNSRTYIMKNDSTTQYSILLVGTNSCGIDSLRKSITVFPPDVKAFIEDPGFFQCQYDTISLFSYSTKGAINTWKIKSPSGMILGDSGDKTTILLNEFGNYEAILYANRCGIDTDTLLLNVKPAPILDFEIPTSVCQGDQISILNKSINIASSLWDFGDNSTSSQTNPQHIYSTFGTFQVKLTSNSLVNNCSNSVVKQIKILPQPQANFMPSTRQACEGVHIDFTNTSTGASRYEWFFEDGTSISSSKNERHVYQNAGKYKVKLTAYNDLGCYSDTTFEPIIIHPIPKSNFDINNTKICLGHDSLSISNTTTNANGYLWNISMDSFKTKDISWLPKAAGNYTIKLKTFNSFGCQDSLTKDIEVLNSPKSYLSPDKSQGCEDLIVVFSNQSKNADTYVWDFGSGNFDTSLNPTYTFKDAGKYNIVLVSKSINGCPNDTAYQSIEVHPIPKASFIINNPIYCGIPREISIQNISKRNFINSWYVNDILVSSEKNLSNQFTQAGKYKIGLRIQSDQGCIDSMFSSIEIFPQPIASFTFNKNACENQGVQIANNSINANTYQWYISNVLKSSETNPIFTFIKSGKYQIGLIAIQNQYCKDTLVNIEEIHIFDTPEADFDYVTAFDENIIGEVKFNNLSMDYNMSSWNFGDGFFSELDHPSHEYEVNRDIKVWLTVLNTHAGIITCIDSISKNIAPEWITTFYAPNAMSPEYGDEMTKVFRPVGKGIKEYRISIFSPWGEKVWESNRLENDSPIDAWDGMYKGNIVPQGAYSWIAELVFVSGLRKIKKGSVTVLR